MNFLRKPNLSSPANGRKKIEVLLNGGLGNQMFQYAFARTIADKNSCDLLLDIAELRCRRAGVTHREYGLKAFNIRASTISSQPLLNKYKLAILSRIPDISLALGVRVELGHQFQQEAFCDNSSTYFKGYWQSPLYFAHNAYRLMEDFSPLKELSDSAADLISEVQSKNSIMLHVRRGDYVTLASAAAHHTALTLDYYKIGIDICKSKIYEPLFYVFSDDIEWCREALSFLDSPLIYVLPDSKRADWEDLIIMSYCKNHIIANSSFSWWSAWIADQRYSVENRIVCAPFKWFATTAIAKIDRFPPHWNVC